MCYISLGIERVDGWFSGESDEHYNFRLFKTLTTAGNLDSIHSVEYEVSHADAFR